MHVGYDYHLYVGDNVSCERTLTIAFRSVLFVDVAFASPYHVDPATGEHV
jgi:hypothetical protein